MVRKSIINIALLLACSISLVAQIRMNGYIRDGISQEPLIGASLFNHNTKQGCITNNEGYYSFICSQNDSITISYVGYQDTSLIASQLTGFNIHLRPGYELSIVEVHSQALQTFDINRLTAKDILQLPSLGAKPDVMKAIQLLPGILTQNEGAGTILVRGGDPGQNLYLLDNVPLIYVHHLGGFMSVFNPDIINSLDLYKGGFPSKYGGKLSSIVDISQKEGAFNERKGNLSIGVTDLSFAVEGPLKQLKNASYIFTGRKTLVDPLMWGASTISDGGGTYSTFYGFHDINGKLTWKKDPQNIFNINLYYGDDYLRFKGRGENKSKDNRIWGNVLASTKWKHLFNSGLHVSNILSYNNYRIKRNQVIKNKGEDKQFYKYSSSVKNGMFRSDWHYTILKDWNIEYGVQNNWWHHLPNRSETDHNQLEVLDGHNSFELSPYIENKISLKSFLHLSIGGRQLNYFSKDFTYSDVEPRVRLNLNVTRNHAFNISYMKVNQSSHLLFTPGDIMQNEIWLSTNKDIPLASAEQLSAAWKGYFNNKMYNAEFNVYQKQMRNLVAYKEGYSFMPGDVSWQDKLEIDGKGYSYGTEFLIKKEKGRFKGFISYAYSHTTRQFSNINNGKEYLYEYDRPHSISTSFSHDINAKLKLNALWVYQTGLPYTPAIGKRYTIGTDNDEPYLYEALIYGERNSKRIKNYHRLDLSLNYETVSKNNNKVIWTFSLYNAYMRQNPHHYYYNTSSDDYFPEPAINGDIENLKLYQVSYMPFIPSVSYKVFFDAEHHLKRNKRPRDSWKFKQLNQNVDN